MKHMYGIFVCACYWIHHLSITLSSSKRSCWNCTTQGGLGVDSDSSELLFLTTSLLLSILGGSCCHTHSNRNIPATLLYLVSLCFYNNKNYERLFIVADERRKHCGRRLSFPQDDAIWIKDLGAFPCNNTLPFSLDIQFCFWYTEWRCWHFPVQLEGWRTGVLNGLLSKQLPLLHLMLLRPWPAVVIVDQTPKISDSSRFMDFIASWLLQRFTRR